MNKKNIILIGTILVLILHLQFQTVPGIYQEKSTESQSLMQLLAETFEEKDEKAGENDKKSILESSVIPYTENEEYFEYSGKSYKVIEVDGGNLSGDRDANVAVDVGYGDRVYWALTNEYSQLVYVVADEIILQDDKAKAVTSDGRYYADEAKVPGTEQKDLDEGHVIADSLGGVSNAYNITPQNSMLNRYGDQAYMEKVIRDAGGCENFVATIIYDNSSSQIPVSYKYEYTLNGNRVIDEFENTNPDNTAEEMIYR